MPPNMSIMKKILLFVAAGTLLYSCEGLDFSFTNNGQREEQGEEQQETHKPAGYNENGSGETNGYHLVWADYFNDGRLDTSIWNVEVNGNGGGNNELQYYAAENVTVGDDGFGRGCLILTARKEESHGKHFTSGRLNTNKKKAFTHGKIESSIKLPKTANGLWPAFWMLGNNFNEVNWPRCGEIDILEMGNSAGISRGTQETFFNGACHWGFYKNNGYPNYAKSTTNSYSLQDGEYHLFTLIWDEQAIKMYLDLDKYPDASPYFEMGINEYDPAGPQDSWSTGDYFHHDFFIVYDLAVGGNFTGIHNTEGITALADGERSMYIDYVKVYQK